MNAVLTFADSDEQPVIDRPGSEQGRNGYER
jgi:hypothetical protein